MKFINTFTCNNILEEILSQKEEVVLYDQLNKIYLTQKRPYSDEYLKLQELKETLPVGIITDFRAIKSIMNVECNDTEWNDNFLTMQIKVIDIHALPNRLLDSELRAWFYIQLFFIKNGKSNELGLSEEQKNKLLYLEKNIVDNSTLEELHDDYIQYYDLFLNHNLLPYNQVSLLLYFKKQINDKVEQHNQSVRLTYNKTIN